MTEKLPLSLASRFASDFVLPREIVSPPPLKDREPLITDFYNVENDILFLRKYTRNSSIEVKVHYLRENILGLLAEFAGKVPYRKITYLLDDSGLTYGEIRMLDMLEHTTNIAGGRERQENIGHSWVYQEFENPYQQSQPFDHAVIISPPWNWDYGYLFYYAKEFDQDLGQNVVKMHAIKYDEKRHQIGKSQNILRKLNPVYIYKTAKEFLETPVFDLTNAPNLNAILLAAGTTQEDVDYSHWFENQVKIDRIIKFGETAYLQLALDLEENETLYTLEERQKKLSEMELIIIGVYNRAREIKKNYNSNFSFVNQSCTTSFDIDLPNIKDGLMAYRQAFTNYTSRSATVPGGGSCPSVNNENSSGFLSSYNLSEGLSNGITPEQLISEKSGLLINEDGACGHCSKENDGHYHCPRCNKMYTDETNIPAEQRTKVCLGTFSDGQPCNFKFNC